MTDPPPASRRVIDAGAAVGIDVRVHRFENTKTARDAAGAVGCELGAIVKSLVFIVDDEPVLALVPGDRRLDTAALARVVGGTEARRAPLDVVRDATGFAAGGTPPFGHRTSLRIFADDQLRRFNEVWAAAGTPETVFPLELDLLLRATGAEIVSISTEL
jgi:prolyl-tRNA editing enzyme YbaK/EbsC (Cys-tRNA(Pro) deacylase)